MKKLLYFLLLALLTSCVKHKDSDYTSGEDLQVLYEKVWAYDDPSDLSSRAGVLGYYNKVKFIDYDKNYPKYIKISANQDKEYYVKSNLVAPKRVYSIEKISEEIKAGIRARSQYSNKKINHLINLSFWQSLIISLIFLLILFLIWKNFYRLELMFAKKSIKNKVIIYRPWFIKNALLSGLVLGAFHTFFAPTETEWFLFEGFSIYPKFPSLVHYILWVASMFFIASLVIIVIKSFLRFELVIAIIYSTLISILMLIYFYSGLLFGGIVAAVLFFVGNSKGSGSQPANEVYDPSKSARWNKLERFYK